MEAYEHPCGMVWEFGAGRAMAHGLSGAGSFVGRCKRVKTPIEYTTLQLDVVPA